MKKNISKKTLSVFIILFIAIFSLFAGFIILSNGIYFEKLNIAKIEIKGFHLKLNNKFIINIDEINLKDMINNKEQESNEEIEKEPLDMNDIGKYVKYAMWGVAYFEQFNIDKIILNNDYEASIHFDGTEYSIIFPNLQAFFNINYAKDFITLNIKKLEIQDPDIFIEGKLLYSLNDRQLGFNTSIASKLEPESKLFLQGASDFKTLAVKIKTAPLAKLDFIRTLLKNHLPKKVRNELDKWLFKALTFEQLELREVKFKLNLDSSKLIESLMKNTKLDLTIREANYKLGNNITPIKAKMAYITFVKEKAVIVFEKPSFDGYDLLDSNIVFAPNINNLNKPTLYININAINFAYTKSLSNLLKTFNVSIPLDEINGKTKANLKLSIGFNKNEIDFGAKGSVIVNDGNIKIGNLVFNTKSAQVDLNISKNNKIIEVQTNHTTYQKMFDIDTFSKILLDDKKIQTKLSVHNLRVSTNLNENQGILKPDNLHDLLDFNKDNKIDSSSLNINSNEVESNARLMLKSHILHLANKINAYAVLAENDNIKTDIKSPIESNIDNKQPESIKNVFENIDTPPVEEEVITPLENELEQEEQEEINKAQDEVRIDLEESKKEEAKLESNEAESNIDNKQPDSINDSINEVKETKTKNNKKAESKNFYSFDENGFIKLNFLEPLNEEQTQWAIQALLKEEQYKKFTFDVFKANSKNIKEIDIVIDFNSSPITISIPKLQTYIEILNHETKISLLDFKSFYPYSPLMAYLGLKEGSGAIYIQSNNNLGFEFNINNYTNFLLDKNKQIINNFELMGSLKDHELEIQTTDENIKLETQDNITYVKIKDIDIDIDALLESNIPIIKDAFNTQGGDKNKTPSFTKAQLDNEAEFLSKKRRYQREHKIKQSIIAIEAKNITGFFKNIVLPFDEVNARIRDDIINADAINKNGIANVDILHGNIIFKAGNFSGDFLNTIIDRKIVHGGLFGVKGVYKDGIFDGEITMTNTAFKGFALVQNILSLIDAIPSLIMFKNPGFGTNGYEVTQGSIHILLNNKYIGLESINLIGKTMDAKGNGVIELDTQEIDLGLSISTLKNLSGILNKIPIVGFLIVGKDGEITTQVGVNGTLSDPKTEVSLAKDLITAPVRILERAFTPIDIIIDEIRKSDD